MGRTVDPRQRVTLTGIKLLDNLVDGSTAPDEGAAVGSVLARRDGQLVGVALCRTFPHGTGWVSQLAVSVPERGHGLGRALLLEGLHRQVAAGATQLGLGVSATNRGALELYLSVGLTVDREWLHHRPA